VGSLGGLVALRRGEAHCGGAHLLDPETGVYNVSYVQRYLPQEEIVLVTLVGREQGWIVPPGNPKGVAPGPTPPDRTSRLSTGSAAQARVCCWIMNWNSII
jgi:hypothetical protein